MSISRLWCRGYLCLWKWGVWQMHLSHPFPHLLNIIAICNMQFSVILFFTFFCEKDFLLFHRGPYTVLLPPFWPSRVIFLQFLVFLLLLNSVIELYQITTVMSRFDLDLKNYIDHFATHLKIQKCGNPKTKLIFSITWPNCFLHVIHDCYQCVY